MVNVIRGIRVLIVLAALFHYVKHLLIDVEEWFQLILLSALGSAGARPHYTSHNFFSLFLPLEIDRSIQIRVYECRRKLISYASSSFWKVDLNLMRESLIGFIRLQPIIFLNFFNPIEQVPLIKPSFRQQFCWLPEESAVEELLNLSNRLGFFLLVKAEQ